VAHLEVVRVPLVIEDVAARQRRLIQMPDQNLVVQREIAKSVGVELDDGRLADALEEILPLRRGSRSRGRLSARARCRSHDYLSSVHQLSAIELAAISCHE